VIDSVNKKNGNENEDDLQPICSLVIGLAEMAEKSFRRKVHESDMIRKPRIPRSQE
jgi:hypothetical protein